MFDLYVVRNKESRKYVINSMKDSVTPISPYPDSVAFIHCQYHRCSPCIIWWRIRIYIYNNTVVFNHCEWYNMSTISHDCAGKHIKSSHGSSEVSRPFVISMSIISQHFVVSYGMIFAYSGNLWEGCTKPYRRSR